jgi:FtsP/CotA-like multicopper oxidase with cupredoxin domain
VEPLDPRQAQTTRTFLFQRGAKNWKINGQPFNPVQPIVASRLGATEIWRFVSDFHHPIHVHLDPFQVLSRNGGPPGPFDGGWKDTVDLHPAEELSVAIRLADYPGRYVMHCHNLEHEDMAMMATFNVD